MYSLVLTLNLSIPTHFVIRQVLYPKLKQMAKFNPRKRIRLCAHRQPKENLHEMFIVHAKDCYVRPHKHLGKAESMTVLEGETDVVLFEEDGTIFQIIEMGDQRTGKMFFNRLGSPVFHMLLIRSEFLIFYEVTEGPFLREKTEFPLWAPMEGVTGVNEFIAGLASSVEKHKHQKP